MAKVGEAWSASLESGAAYEIVLRFERHDGAYHSHRGRARLVWGEAGKVVRWLGGHMDLTEQAHE